MNHLIPVGLRASLFNALCNAVGEGYFGDKCEDALCEAVTDWLARDRSEPDAKTEPRMKAGYQWKQLFLPDGTELRVTERGRVRYAAVEGNLVVYNGKSISPSQFANTGDVVRNAWRVVWLKLPGEEWERAAERRAPWRQS